MAQNSLVRLRNGRDQKEIAKALGVTRKAIGHWENGVRTPRLKHLEKLADFYQVDINTILACTKRPLIEAR